MSDKSMQRRKFPYGAATAGVLGLAGCNSGDGGGGDGNGDSQSLSLRAGTSAGGTQDVGLAAERAVSQMNDTLDYSTIESPGYIGTIRQMANFVSSYSCSRKTASAATV